MTREEINKLNEQIWDIRYAMQKMEYRDRRKKENVPVEFLEAINYLGNAGNLLYGLSKSLLE